MAKTSSPASTLLEREGKSRMWLRLIWQLRELLPLLGRMLPLLEGWVAGNSGASAATSRALEKLESRVASAVGGVNSTQEEMGRQIREQGLVLQQLTSDMKHMRALVEREAMEREVLRKTWRGWSAGRRPSPLGWGCAPSCWLGSCWFWPSTSGNRTALRETTA